MSVNCQHSNGHNFGTRKSVDLTLTALESPCHCLTTCHVKIIKCTLRVPVTPSKVQTRDQNRCWEQTVCRSCFNFIHIVFHTKPQPGKRRSCLKNQSELCRWFASNMKNPWIEATFCLALLKNPCHSLAEKSADVRLQKATIATANVPTALLKHQL